MADPELRARLSAARKKAMANPEARARLSVAATRLWAEFRAARRATKPRNRGWAVQGRTSFGELPQPLMSKARALGKSREKHDLNFAQDPDAAEDRMRKRNKALEAAVAQTGDSAMSRKLYSTVEVAKAAGVPRATLQHWMKTGKIAAPRVRLRRNRAVRLWTDARRSGFGH